MLIACWAVWPQLQQLQQAQQQQQQQAAAAASQAGNGLHSAQSGTPKTPPVMNLGAGALGQLFDWQPNQAAPSSQAVADFLSGAGGWGDLAGPQLLGGPQVCAQPRRWLL
jgi:hypothetical protein